MSETPVIVHNLHHTYLPGTPVATEALVGADLTLYSGEVAALIGASGAGKSTLAHFVNGLLRPEEPGRVLICDQDTASRNCDIGELRRRVGLVFQYPYQQLLERYVGDDVAYGPRQLDLPADEVLDRVQRAMRSVGLDFEQFADRQTFSLSGGEMRRVALAGVLTMEPELLILDEATTGLDPTGRAEVHTLLRRLRDEMGTTILLVSNDMDEVAELADRTTVLYRGRTVMAGPTREVFSEAKALHNLGLAPPAASEIVLALRKAGLDVDRSALTPAEAEEAIWRAMTS